MMPCCALVHVAVGGLQQLQDNVFDVLADVARFGQRGGVHDGEGNIQHARERLRQQRLAGAGGADQQDIGLGQFHVARLAVQEDALVMVVDRDGQLLLGLVLADHVAVEKRLDLRRARQPPVDGVGLFALFLFQNLLADAHALVADVRARIVRGRADQLLDLLLRFMAEGTAQRFVWCEPFSLMCCPLPAGRPTRSNCDSYCRTEALRMAAVIIALYY